MAYGDRQLSNQRQAVRRDPGVQRIELGLGYIAAGRKAIFIRPHVYKYIISDLPYQKKHNGGVFK